jgi:hypothetical protein
VKATPLPNMREPRAPIFRFGRQERFLAGTHAIQCGALNLVPVDFSYVWPMLVVAFDITMLWKAQDASRSS